MSGDGSRYAGKQDLAILSFWGEHEAEWARFSEIWKHAKEKMDSYKGSSGKVRFIRRLNRLREKGVLEKRVLEDRSTQYRLKGVSVVNWVVADPLDAEVTIIFDELMTLEEKKEFEKGLKEAIEAIRKHLPSRRSISRLVIEWSF